MTIRLRGSSKVVSNSTTATHTLDKITGLQANDLLTSAMVAESATVVFTNPTGYRSFGVHDNVAEMSGWGAWKKAGSEPLTNSWVTSITTTGIAVMHAFYDDQDPNPNWQIYGPGTFDYTSSSFAGNTSGPISLADGIWFCAFANDDNEDVNTEPLNAVKLLEIGGAGAPDGTAASTSIASYFYIRAGGGYTQFLDWGGTAEQTFAIAAGFRNANDNSLTQLVRMGVFAPAAAAGGTTVTSLLGEVNVEGFLGAVTTTREITALLGEVHVEGFLATVEAVFPEETVTSLLGEVNVEGFLGAVTTTREVTALLGEVNVQGFTGTVTTTRTISALLGEVNVQGFTGTVVRGPVELTGLLGEINVEGFLGSVTTGQVQGITVESLLGEINVVGFIPMVSLGKWTAIQKNRLAWTNVDPVSSAWATVSAQSTSWTSIDPEC